MRKSVAKDVAPHVRDPKMKSCDLVLLSKSLEAVIHKLQVVNRRHQANVHARSTTSKCGVLKEPQPPDVCQGEHHMSYESIVSSPVLRGRGINFILPLFNGENSRQFVSWLYDVECYFENKHFSEKVKLEMVVSCLKGVALSWYTSLLLSRLVEGKGKLSTWVKLEKCMRLRFLSSSTMNELKHELRTLKQKSLSVLEYAKLFEELNFVCDQEVSLSQMKLRFYLGLKSEIAKEINLVVVHTYGELLDMTLDVEKSLEKPKTYEVLTKEDLLGSMKTVEEEKGVDHGIVESCLNVLHHESKCVEPKSMEVLSFGNGLLCSCEKCVQEKKLQRLDELLSQECGQVLSKVGEEKHRGSSQVGVNNDSYIVPCLGIPNLHCFMTSNSDVKRSCLERKICNLLTPHFHYHMLLRLMVGLDDMSVAMNFFEWRNSVLCVNLHRKLVGELCSYVPMLNTCYGLDYFCVIIVKLMMLCPKSHTIVLLTFQSNRVTSTEQETYSCLSTLTYESMIGIDKRVSYIMSLSEWVVASVCLSAASVWFRTPTLNIMASCEDLVVKWERHNAYTLPFCNHDEKRDCLHWSQDQKWLETLWRQVMECHVVGCNEHYVGNPPLKGWTLGKMKEQTIISKNSYQVQELIEGHDGVKLHDGVLIVEVFRSGIKVVQASEVKGHCLGIARMIWDPVNAMFKNKSKGCDHYHTMNIKCKMRIIGKPNGSKYNQWNKAQLMQRLVRRAEKCSSKKDCTKPPANVALYEASNEREHVLMPTREVRLPWEFELLIAWENRVLKSKVTVEWMIAWAKYKQRLWTWECCVGVEHKDLRANPLQVGVVAMSTKRQVYHFFISSINMSSKQGAKQSICSKYAPKFMPKPHLNEENKLKLETHVEASGIRSIIMLIRSKFITSRLNKEVHPTQPVLLGNQCNNCHHSWFQGSNQVPAKGASLAK